MPRSTVKDEDPYYLPKDVLLTAQLIKVEERTFTYTIKKGSRAGQVGSGSNWEWEFAIIEPGEHMGKKAVGTTEAKITSMLEPSFKDRLARPWIETLLGRQLLVGEDFDTDDLLGLTCRLTCDHEEPRPKKDGGFFYPCPVDQLFPMDGSSEFVPF
jgi:hypothetical protein